MGWGRRMATPPWWPPPGPGRDGHGTTFAEGKSPCHCAAAAACQCVSCRQTILPCRRWLRMA
eukprot:875597-Heterocapsa_arctica.AAC.1